MSPEAMIYEETLDSGTSIRVCAVFFDPPKQERNTTRVKTIWQCHLLTAEQHRGRGRMKDILPVAVGKMFQTRPNVRLQFDIYHKRDQNQHKMIKRLISRLSDTCVVTAAVGDDSKYFAELKTGATQETASQQSTEMDRGGAPPPLPPSRRPCGLANLGNTCFMSAVLQCLAGTNLFDCIGRDAVSVSKTQVEMKMYVLLKGFLKEMGDSPNANLQPKDLKTVMQVVLPQYKKGKQEDPAEFLFKLLDSLDTTIDRSRYKVTGQGEAHSVGQIKSISEKFAGSFLISTKCSVCTAESFTVDEFAMLALAIADRPAVTDLLEHFTKVHTCTHV